MAQGCNANVVLFLREGCRAAANQAEQSTLTFPSDSLQGYNKRATVLFLLNRYQESIEDCRVVLELNPWHFAAASGMGLCYRWALVVHTCRLASAWVPGAESDSVL